MKFKVGDLIQSIDTPTRVLQVLAADPQPELLWCFDPACGRCLRCFDWRFKLSGEGSAEAARQLLETRFYDVLEWMIPRVF